MSDPDRVEYGPWEDDPDTEYEERKLIATAFSLLSVLEYTEVVHKRYRRQRRLKVEVWETRRATVPRFLPNGDCVAVLLPPLTSARESYEYRPVEGSAPDGG